MRMTPTNCRRGRGGNVLYFSDQSRMIQAILKGEIHTVKHLIANNEDVNCTDVERRSYLHLASFINATEIAKILIAAGARVNCRDNDWYTPIHRACRNNLDIIVSILMAHGADVNTRDRSWITPLHVCAANNALECARLFVSKISNIEVTDRNGATALHHAAFNGHCDVITFLLKNGASPNAFDKKDRRPLHYAAVIDNTDAIRLLIEKGGEVDVRDKEMLTPLHIASAKGCLNAIQMLVEYGANVVAVDVHGNTPLHWACLHGQDDVIDELVTSGAALNAINHMGITPLHYAAASTPGTPALEMLINHKDVLDINVKDKYGRTPLHLASKFGRLGRVTDLIRCGADVNATDRQMLAPLHNACRGGHTPVVEALIAQNNIEVNLLDVSGMTPLHHAAFSGASGACQLLLKSNKPANLYIRDVSGRTPHFLAAFSGNLESLQAMEPLPGNVDSFNRSLLHYAAARSNYECLQYLIKHERNYCVNQKDMFGKTPLIYACALEKDCEDARCVEILLSAGAKIDLADDEDLYCIHYAAATGKIAVLETLFKCDTCSIWNRLRFKLCPSYCAAFYGKMECLDFLLSKGICENISKAIEYATISGNVNCLQLLLNHEMFQSPSFGISLHLAALKSRLDCLSMLLSRSDEVDLVDSKMRTPLMVAALHCKNNYNCIDILLKRNANINAIDCNGRNVLFYAVFSGHEDSVRGFLARSANLLKRDVGGKTVFHLAAAMGHSDVLNSLINGLSAITANDSGLHESMLDKERFTPLHWACLKSQHNTVTILLENSKLKTFYGSSTNPLHIAAFVGSEKCMELLISHYGKSIIQLVNNKGRSVLHHLCMSKSENIACLVLLLKNKLDVNLYDGEKRTPLMYAVERGFNEIALKLLEHGADPKLEDKKGNNSLHYACIYKREPVGIRIMDSTPCLVHSTNCDLKTALHLAAANGMVSLTQKLLLAGASVTASDMDNMTPSLCCAKNCDVAECLMLIETIMIYEEVSKKSANSEEGGEASAYLSPNVKESRNSFMKRASAHLFANSSFSGFPAPSSHGTNSGAVSNLSSIANDVDSVSEKGIPKEHSSSDSDFY